MKSFGRLIAVTLVAVAAVMASIGPARAAAPILIKSCTVAKPKPMSHMANGLDITYVNLGNKTAASITFAVGYRNASMHYLRRVTDVGSFAPGRDDYAQAQLVQRRHLCRSANVDVHSGSGQMGRRDPLGRAILALTFFDARFQGPIERSALAL